MTRRKTPKQTNTPQTQTAATGRASGLSARSPGLHPGKLSERRRADPYFERESAKYDHPLPSREYIEQILAERGVPMLPEELATALDILDDELEAFQRRLGAMERDGQLMRNRKGACILPDKADLIRGRVEGHPDGYGFLVPDDGGADLFLGPKSMREVLHGDRVLARAAGLDYRGRREARIVEVLERANVRVVGRVIAEHGLFKIAPENRRISQEILIAPGGRIKLAAGQVVVVEIVQQPSQNAQPIGRVAEILGNYADPGMEIEIALRKHDLPFEFSSAAKAEARKLPDTVRRKDWAGREDLTGLPLVTIDGETAKDFDDAVYCEPQGKGFRLLVAIADVSHYVQPGMQLDDEALERGNSVYFPRRVIPMLPEKLSNGLCSLNPQVERLCMVCDMHIGPTGAIKQYRFYPAVMFSHARLTYNQVAAALYDGESEALVKVGALLPQLRNLDAVFRVLLKARAKRGAIDFETLETRMIFDEQGKIERIVPETRNDAHRIIEECMLAANVCASSYLHEHRHPSLYRVHEGPTPERLEKLRNFLADFGLDLGGGDEPKAGDYARLIDKIKGRPDASLLQTVMLRSLRQALYSPDNVGHFGLAYDAYTHFTSPIRRYPDLLVHRSIKAVLAGERYAPGDWSDIGLRCSQTERRADEASRDVEAWLKCWYMQDRVGERFSGSVTAAVPFGLFVTLDELFVEGLIHISELGHDYFHYDEVRHELAGERTGERFRLSDRVKVQVVRVDLETRKIDFKLIEGPPRDTRRSGKTAADHARKAGRERQSPDVMKRAAEPEAPRRKRKVVEGPQAVALEPVVDLQPVPEQLPQHATAPKRERLASRLMRAAAELLLPEPRQKGRGKKDVVAPGVSEPAEIDPTGGRTGTHAALEPKARRQSKSTAVPGPTPKTKPGADAKPAKSASLKPEPKTESVAAPDVAAKRRAKSGLKTEASSGKGAVAREATPAKRQSHVEAGTPAPVAQTVAQPLPAVAPAKPRGKKTTPQPVATAVPEPEAAPKPAKRVKADVPALLKARKPTKKGEA